MSLPIAGGPHPKNKQIIGDKKLLLLLPKIESLQKKTVHILQMLKAAQSQLNLKI
jgi:hypothetical protein